MKWKQAILLIIVTGLSLAAPPPYSDTYESNWESLQDYPRIPEWLHDAKFGIYWHWGVYSVPAFGNEWYPRNMYNPKSDVYRFHQTTYGNCQTVGFHDLVPLWQAPNFDPNDWADLCIKAGAKFAGSIAVHHDNFLLWDSQLSPWNSVQKGPKIDVVGESAQAIKARGLKVITSFHHAWTSKYYEFAFRNAGNSVKQHPLLYTEPWRGKEQVTQAYQDLWLAKVQEVVNKYQPDLMYFDWGLEQLIAPPHHQALFAYFYNHSQRQNREVAITCQPGYIQQHTGLQNHTWRHPATISKIPFTTDGTIAKNSWSYTQGMSFNTTKRLLTNLIDIVSKNGIYILNISPQANGTIDQEQRTILTEFGQWLKQNGPAIYNTRPWTTYGEGPSTKTQHKFIERRKAPPHYTDQDFRYTQSKDSQTIYAHQLVSPTDNTSYLLKAFKDQTPTTIKSVQRLDGKPIQWQHIKQGLQIRPTAPPPNDLPVVYKILLEPTNTVTVTGKYTDNYKQKLTWHLLEYGDKKKLNLGLALPKNFKASTTKTYPLVLYLHGAGARGSNIQRVLHRPTAREFVWHAQHQTGKEAIIIAPQVPTGQKYVQVPWNQGPYEQSDNTHTQSMQLTESLLDYLLTQDICNIPANHMA